MKREERSTQLESRTVEITRFEQQRETILKKREREKTGGKMRNKRM